VDKWNRNLASRRGATPAEQKTQGMCHTDSLSLKPNYASLIEGFTHLFFLENTVELHIGNIKVKEKG
jgi:hypothetical protein